MRFSKITQLPFSRSITPFSQPGKSRYKQLITCLKQLMEMETEFRLPYFHFPTPASIRLVNWTLLNKQCQTSFETVTDFLFLGSKITADGDHSHEIKRRLLLGRKARQHIKKHYFAEKVRPVKAMVFPVVKYGYVSRTIKKAECRRIDAFELWC